MILRLFVYNSNLTKVIVAIPNSTETVVIPYPTGFNRDNIILLGAKCSTKYNSDVDSSYDGYFGDLNFRDNGINYTPKVAGNTLSITFMFGKQ